MSPPCSCLKLFECGQYEGRTLQIEVDNSFPEFVCESETCSSHSPGIVEDDERLAFLLIEPIHFDDQTGQISPDAFQEVTNRDLSLLREKYCTVEMAEETRALLRIPRKPDQQRYVEKVTITTATLVRQTTIEGKRVICVYDTAIENNPSHASIFTTSEILSSGAGRKKIRRICHALFSNEIEEFADFKGRLQN